LPSIAPMLATLGQLPPHDLDRRYGYEVKWDGSPDTRGCLFRVANEYLP
jgi:hypothetical protein